MEVASLLGLLGLGLGASIFGTIIGAGGGFVAVPLLIILFGFEPQVATGTSLVFIFFNSLSGGISYLRQRRVDVRVGLMFMLMGIPGAVIGALVSTSVEKSLFKLLLAILLLAVSLYSLLRPSELHGRSRVGGSPRRRIDAWGNEYRYSVNIPLGLLLSFAISFMGGLFGLGGGIIYVPAMILLFGFPTHIATATSHFLMIFTSLTAAATHASLGSVGLAAIPLSVGAVIGAQLGAATARRLRGRTIQRILGVALIIVAIRLLA